MKLAIRTRLTAWYAVFVALTLLALGAFLVLELRAELRRGADRELRSSTGAIAQGLRSGGLTSFHQASVATLRRSGSAAQVLDSRGNVIASFGGDVAQDTMLSRDRVAAGLTGASLHVRTVALGDSHQLYHVISTPVQRGRQRQLVVVAESLQAIDEAVRKILVLLVIAGPIVLAAVAAAAWLLLGGALAPVERMRRKAELIGIDRLGERLHAPNPRDEVGQLASTLNAMLDRLQQGVRERRQLVADASHELRTPLAAMRAELDVALREPKRTDDERRVMSSLRDDVDRMSRTVDNLLTLARADDGRLELLRADLDLRDVVEEAVGPLRTLVAGAGVRVEAGGEHVRTIGDPHRLHQAVRNLLENAMKYTPAGGLIEVTTWRREQEVGLTVADSGIGISAEAREHVFDRFFRVDRSRSRESGGSGLGLAICWEIATAHGGRIWVESEEGGGSAFSIALPASERAGSDPPRDAAPGPGPDPALTAPAQRPGK